MQSSSVLKKKSHRRHKPLSTTMTTLGERSTPRWSTEIAAPVIWAPLLSTSFNRGFQAVKAIPLENLAFWKVFVCMNMSHRSQWSAIMFPQNFRRGTPGCKHAAECLRVCSTAVVSSWDTELISHCWKLAWHSNQCVIVLCTHAGMLPVVPRAEVA